MLTVSRATLGEGKINMTEAILEPELPIIDPHHHLWDRVALLQQLPPATHPFEAIVRQTPRYLLDELLTDVGSGHNVIASVYVQCGAFYRADGPDELKPVGETEFVRGYRVDDATFTAFLAFAETRGVRVVATRPAVVAGDSTSATDVLVRSEVAASRREIETRIKAFMARRLFESEAFWPVITQIDPVVQAAMQQWQTATTALAQAQ